MRNTPKANKVRAFTTNFDRLRMNGLVMRKLTDDGFCLSAHKLPNELEGSFLTTNPPAYYKRHFQTAAVKIVVVPSATKMTGSSAFGNQRKVKGIPRVFIQCTCGKLVPTGKAGQHTHEMQYGTYGLVPLPEI